VSSFCCHRDADSGRLITTNLIDDNAVLRPTLDGRRSASRDVVVEYQDQPASVPLLSRVF